MMTGDIFRCATTVLAAAALIAAPQAQAAGDAGRGKAAFGACSACHSVIAGKNGVGPSLFGVAGRHAGTAPGYSYSAAMKASGAWTAQQLDAYLANPKAAIPGNKMPFSGVSDPQKRADIIAYLATLK